MCISSVLLRRTASRIDFEGLWHSVRQMSWSKENRVVLVMSAILGSISTTFAAALPGQIVVDPANPSWLRYEGGGSHFMAAPGDPENFLYRGSRAGDGTRDGDQLELIQKLIDNGGNGIYMQVIRSHGGDGDATHNPFVDSDPGNGLDPDILNQWDTWFTRMDNNGIVIYLFIYDDSASVWNTGDSVGAEERAFLEGIVNRFEKYKNLVWIVAEEYEETFSAARISNIAGVIRAADDHDHVIGVHNLATAAGFDFSEFANDANIDQQSLQTNEVDPDSLHRTLVSLDNDAADRYNITLSELQGHSAGSDASVRQKNWAAAMAGSYVMVYEMFIDTTPLSQLQDLRTLQYFMESFELSNLSSRDDLAFMDTEYVLANPGNSYIAYGSNVAGQLGLQNLTSGSYDLRWMDITSGIAANQDAVAVSGGSQSWTKPAGFGNEVVVHVQRRDDGGSTGGLFPGASWESRAPADVGLDAAKLGDLSGFVGGAGCIVRAGYMVYCWGGSDSVDQEWASAAKPVLSTLLFFAIQEGRVASVDAPVADWGWSVTAEDESMTFRHLANMTSGYARVEEPGAAWAYNDYAIALYGETLERVFGSDLDSVARDRLAALQFQDGAIFGSRNGHGMIASIRDFARIGLLWLNRGNWNGGQLLPRSYFDNFMQSGVPGTLPRTSGGDAEYLGVGSFGGDSDQTPYGPGIYGFNWWFNSEVATTGNLAWPDAPVDTFQANGHFGGEVVIVIPSMDIVVSAVGNWGNLSDFEPGNPSGRMNQALKLLVEADVGGGSGTTRPAAPSTLVVE